MFEAYFIAIMFLLLFGLVFCGAFSLLPFVVCVKGVSAGFVGLLVWGLFSD